MPMAMFMRETGRMTKLMDVESTLMLMVADMRENGLKISNTASVLKDGQMVQVMKDNTSKEKSMARVNSHGPMQAHSQETSMITIFMGQASMNGLMAVCLLATGETTKWKAMVPLPGQTVVNTSASMLTT